MTELISIAGSLVGVLLGGAITHFVSRTQVEYQDKMTRRREQLSRLEAIHRTLSTLDRQTGLLSFRVTMHAVANRDFDAEELKEELPYNELRLLVDFYAPSLSAQVDAMGIALQQLGEAAVEVAVTQDAQDKRAIAMRAATAANSVRTATTEIRHRLNALAHVHVHKA